MSLRASLIALVLFSGVPAESGARLLQEVDLTAYLHEKRPVLGTGAHQVFSVAFSHDGEWLGVATGFHDTDKGPVTHIVTFQVPSLKMSFETTVRATWVNLQWSSDGRFLLAQAYQESWLLGVRDAATCEIDHQSLMGGFVSSGAFVLARPMLSTTLMTFFDNDCRRISETTLPVRARSMDTSASAGLMAVSGERSDIKLLRSPDWRTFATIADPRHVEVKLFEGGKGVCAGPPTGPGDATFRCWDIDGKGTPREVSSWPSSKGGSSPEAAADVPLVAFIDRGFSYHPFSERQRAPFRRWVIWDAEHGGIVEQVPGKEQAWRFVDKRAPKMPYACALSPDGRYFAIGGDGVVEIYTLGTNASSIGETPEPK